MKKAPWLKYLIILRNMNTPAIVCRPLNRWCRAIARFRTCLKLYVYNDSDLATFYDLATAYKDNLLDFAKYLLTKYEELDISITEFGSFNELLHFAKTNPQNN